MLRRPGIPRSDLLHRWLISHQRHLRSDGQINEDADLIFDLQKLSRTNWRERLLDLAMGLFKEAQPRPLAAEPAFGHVTGSGVVERAVVVSLNELDDELSAVDRL